jgi:hypothetical protein
MGEVFPGPGFRVCSRSACKWPAVTSLGFDYDNSLAWFDDLGPAPQPATYDLCSEHAGRFNAPLGWAFEDRRLLRSQPERTTSLQALAMPSHAESPVASEELSAIEVEGGQLQHAEAIVIEGTLDL